MENSIVPEANKPSKNKKRIIMLCFCIVLLIAGVMCYLYFGAEHIQRRIKEKICAKVIEQEAELSEIAEEWKEETINRAYSDFYLSVIDRREDGSVAFHVRSSIVSVLWDDYRCGFYYSKDDKPIDAVWTHKMAEGETEFEDLIYYGEYWYKTEKITDNWWFYETKAVYKYAMHR